MDYPIRKHPRLKEFNYDSPGSYFITICTKDRKNILGRVVEADDLFSVPTVYLTTDGEITKYYIQQINIVYSGVQVDKYVIMPNHIHMIIQITDEVSTISVSTIVRSLKRMINREIGRSIWQDSFYDHVIRNESSYREIWKYIDENPQKWLVDKYYSQN